jgi:hypothetical protein
MALFWTLLRFVCLLLLPLAFLASLLAGWLGRARTGRTFRGILIRAIALGLGIGIPICIILAAWLAWWLVGNMPAPE